MSLSPGNNSNNQEQDEGKLGKLAPLEAKAKRLKIRGLSMAEFGEKSRTVPSVLGIDNKTEQAVDQDSVFRIMSLSKPVFAYLVLKLIKENEVKKKQPWVGQFTLPEGVEKFDLRETPLWTIYPEMLKKFSPDPKTQAHAKNLTAHDLLSHQSGLPGRMEEGAPLKFNFEPGSQFGYSNPGISLLQDAIEHVTKNDLETIFQAHKPKGMVNSTFIPPIFLNEQDASKKKAEMKAENSLHTTPSEYAMLINAWMSDETLRDMAIKSQVSMQKDKWAVGQDLSDDDLKKVAWGYGLALQKNDKDDIDRVTQVFHWGDGSDEVGNWRSLVGYDLDQKKGVVYFANSRNGLMLADEITSLASVDLKAGLNYIFEKLGFARVDEDGFEEKEGERVGKIIVRHEKDKNEMVAKGMLRIDNSEDKQILSIRCDPDCSMYAGVIYNELNKFIVREGIKDSSCKVIKGDEGNILSLEINIPGKNLYGKFIELLNSQNLMPTPAPMDPRNGDLSGNAALHKMLGANKSTAIAPSAQETELDKKTSAKSDQSAQPVNITDSSNNRTDQRLPTSADTPHTSPKPSGISTKLTRDHTKE